MGLMIQDVANHWHLELVDLQTLRLEGFSNRRIFRGGTGSGTRAFWKTEGWDMWGMKL